VSLQRDITLDYIIDELEHCMSAYRQVIHQDVMLQQALAKLNDELFKANNDNTQALLKIDSLFENAIRLVEEERDDAQRLDDEAPHPQGNDEDLAIEYNQLEEKFKQLHQKLREWQQS
jgi:DNA repair exonuclease SbcCD ATPase subunit